MESCNSILKFCLLYVGERLLPLFLPCYVVGSCACSSWFLINSKWNTLWITFKLMQNVYDVRRNDWNKVSQNITEEFSWKLQWPVYKNNTVSMLNSFDMFNARKIQEFVMFISRLFLRYPREAFCPLIYEYNISMYLILRRAIHPTCRKVKLSVLQLNPRSVDSVRAAARLKVDRWTQH